jgi:hypothetical protein
MSFIICRHILTGLGVYYYMQFLLYLRLCLEGNREKYDFHWASGFLPIVETKVKFKGKRVSNGRISSNGLKVE